MNSRLRFPPPKQTFGADLGQPDDPDGVAVRGHDLHAGAGAGPDVAVDVAAHAVGARYGVGVAGHRELHMTPPVAERAAPSTSQTRISRPLPVSAT